MTSPDRDEASPEGDPATRSGRTGRPRDPGIDEAVLDAAAEQLVAGGPLALRMDALADRVGVAKTTLYRRWPSRAHLLVAVLARGQQEVGTPSTGDVRADLVAFTTRLAATLDPPVVRQLAAQLAAAAAEDPDLAAPVRALWAARRRQVAGIVEAGIADGQLRPDAPAATIVDQLAGALYYHVLVTGEPLGDAYAEDLVDAVLRGALPG